MLPAEYQISRRTRALNRLSVGGDVGMFKACREMALERLLSAFGIEKEQKVLFYFQGTIVGRPLSISRQKF